MVDGAPIPLSLLQRELDRIRRAPPTSAQEGSVLPGADAGQPEPGDPQKLARALLEPLIDRQILASHARAARIVVSEAEVQRATESLAEDARAAGQKFNDQLAQDGQTLDSLSDETRERLLAEKFVTSELKVEKPSPTEVRLYFEAHRSDFERPEEVRALQIVVATAEEAKNLLEQVRRGTSFEDLARAHSLSPDGKRGGDLGFFAKGTMPAVFDETCFALRPGQVSGVVPSRYGYHLFKLLEKRSARKRSFEESRPVVERRLLAERRVAAERALLSSLRGKAAVQIDDAALAQLR
ncbi:MAG TPA: peptidyl-prolyl cis-trans isomerase [Myxococcales bacterium]|nr:peptidyl-prolyl cis-trans isomerase [Myxococcales bacterium]